jgi:hypothetical protein
MDQMDLTNVIDKALLELHETNPALYEAARNQLLYLCIAFVDEQAAHEKTRRERDEAMTVLDGLQAAVRVAIQNGEADAVFFENELAEADRLFPPAPRRDGE